MDSQASKSQANLQKLFSEFTRLCKLSKDQEDELFTNLEKAITLNIIGRLLDQLGEADRELVEQKKFSNSDELLQFLGTIVPKEKFQQLASLSFEEVTKKFLDKV